MPNRALVLVAVAVNAGGVGVAGDHGRHDRCTGDALALEAVHLKLGGDVPPGRGRRPNPGPRPSGYFQLVWTQRSTLTPTVLVWWMAQVRNLLVAESIAHSRPPAATCQAGGFARSTTAASWPEAGSPRPTTGRSTVTVAPSRRCTCSRATVAERSGPASGATLARMSCGAAAGSSTGAGTGPAGSSAASHAVRPKAEHEGHGRGGPQLRALHFFPPAANSPLIPTQGAGRAQ